MMKEEVDKFVDGLARISAELQYQRKEYEKNVETENGKSTFAEQNVKLMDASLDDVRDAMNMLMTLQCRMGV